jgi:hypothetical protein
MSDADIFGMTEGDARELAEEELFRDSAHYVGKLIAHEPAANRNMGEVMNMIDDGDVKHLSTGELMFAVMYGSQKYVMEAVYELRERTVSANKSVLEDNARSIWENYHAV